MIFLEYTPSILILYASVSKTSEKTNNSGLKTSLPQFRKSIYTKEVIDFILEQVSTGEMTINEVVERYSIPKTTLYKWFSKYKK